MRQHRNPDEAISSKQEIASGKEQERPRNDIIGEVSDVEEVKPIQGDVDLLAIGDS